MDSAPGLELFDSYEADLQQLLAGVKSKFDSEAHQGKAEQRKAVLRRLEMELDEADEIIAQMDIEVQSFLDRSVKPKLQLKLRSYKADLAKRKTEIKDALTNLDRSDLLSGGNFAPDASAAENGLSDAQIQRNRLLSGTDKLQQSTQRLQESHRLALETEDVGASILGSLRGQREQIQGTRDRLQDADRGIDKASGTLGQMIRRMYQQRIITGLIIGVLVALIILLIWNKFR